MFLNFKITFNLPFIDKVLTYLNTLLNMSAANNMVELFAGILQNKNRIEYRSVVEYQIWIRFQREQ